jgi:hypothetical protein
MAGIEIESPSDTTLSPGDQLQFSFSFTQDIAVPGAKNACAAFSGREIRFVIEVGGAEAESFVECVQGQSGVFGTNPNTVSYDVDVPAPNSDGQHTISVSAFTNGTDELVASDSFSVTVEGDDSGGGGTTPIQPEPEGEFPWELVILAGVGVGGLFVLTQSSGGED